MRGVKKFGYGPQYWQCEYCKETHRVFHTVSGREYVRCRDGLRVYSANALVRSLR